jgi:hypothetical protein
MAVAALGSKLGQPLLTAERHPPLLRYCAKPPCGSCRAPSAWSHLPSPHKVPGWPLYADTPIPSPRSTQRHHPDLVTTHLFGDQLMLRLHANSCLPKPCCLVCSISFCAVPHAVRFSVCRHGCCIAPAAGRAATGARHAAPRHAAPRHAPQVPAAAA